MSTTAERQCVHCGGSCGLNASWIGNKGPLCSECSVSSMRFAAVSGDGVSLLLSRIAQLEARCETSGRNAQHFAQECERLEKELAEARRDSERLKALYEMAQISITGFVVIRPMLVPGEAAWDGVTAIWNRDVFNAAIDAARGAK